MITQKKKEHLVSVAYCDGCKYFWHRTAKGIALGCDYFLVTGQRRPCPAGKGCKVKTIGERPKFDALGFLLTPSAKTADDAAKKPKAQQTPQEKKEQRKTYYETHRAQCLAYRKTYYEAHREQILARDRERYWRSKEGK